MRVHDPSRILLVTGLSGAGKTTALKTLEDIGWETVDNLPLRLLDPLLTTAPATGARNERPLAVGIDLRTRGFDADEVVTRVTARRGEGAAVEVLFLDCDDGELERRFSETRRRHPLALDRPPADGIRQERALLAPLRLVADHRLDTSALTTHDLQLRLRLQFDHAGQHDLALVVMSFGFAGGIARNADLVFDVRFLRNPHWNQQLRPLTGQDPVVASYIAGDADYATAMAKFEDLLLFLVPRYVAEGKAYATLAFGCTGGRHRSVHVAERMAARLREAGFSPTVIHRDLGLVADNRLEDGSDTART